MTSSYSLKRFTAAHSKFLIFLWSGVLLSTLLVCVSALKVVSLTESSQDFLEKISSQTQKIHRIESHLYQREHDLARFHLTLESHFLREYLRLATSDTYQGVQSIEQEASDASHLHQQLLQHEMHMTKLLLEGHHVPNELMPKPIAEFRLSEDEHLMSDAQKIVLAQDMLLSLETEALYDDILSTLSTYKASLAEQASQSTQSTKIVSSRYYSLLLIFVGLSVVFLLMILWIRIAEIDQNEEIESKQSSGSILPKFGDEI